MFPSMVLLWCTLGWQCTFCIVASSLMKSCRECLMVSSCQDMVSNCQEQRVCQDLLMGYGKDYRIILETLFVCRYLSMLCSLRWGIFLFFAGMVFFMTTFVYFLWVFHFCHLNSLVSHAQLEKMKTRMLGLVNECDSQKYLQSERVQLQSR